MQTSHLIEQAIFPNFLYLIRLDSRPVPIDTSTISSLGKSFLLFAYAQAAGLLANTPSSTNTLFSCLTSKYLGAKYVGAAVVALSASFSLMKFLFSLQLLRKNGQLLCIS
ncbi:hypothetical protein HCR15_00800 [Wolbachia pipientis]|nr:hypothetical protein [Wolbachia pipientis]